MSLWVKVIKNLKKPVAQLKVVDNEENKEDSKDKDKDEMMKLYNSLGYEDPDYEFDSKYSGDIIDMHIMLQDMCEDMSLDVYHKNCIIKFTDYIKKNSSAYIYFVEDTLDEYYNYNPKDEDSEDD